VPLTLTGFGAADSETDGAGCTVNEVVAWLVSFEESLAVTVTEKVPAAVTDPHETVGALGEGGQPGGRPDQL
jgi:hypothetical protein